jgi:hypothetical protein
MEEGRRGRKERNNGMKKGEETKEINKESRTIREEGNECTHGLEQPNELPVIMFLSLENC